jgi:hypothetical protein
LPRSIGFALKAGPEGATGEHRSIRQQWLEAVMARRLAAHAVLRDQQHNW